MATPAYGVTVNPSSSQYIAPSIGDQSFYFGGNPNAALVLGSATTRPLLYAALAVLALYVLMRFRR